MSLGKRAAGICTAGEDKIWTRGPWTSHLGPGPWTTIMDRVHGPPVMDRVRIWTVFLK